MVGEAHELKIDASSHGGACGEHVGLCLLEREEYLLFMPRDECGTTAASHTNQWPLGLGKSADRAGPSLTWKEPPPQDPQGHTCLWEDSPRVGKLCN